MLTNMFAGTEAASGRNIVGQGPDFEAGGGTQGIRKHGAMKVFSKKE
jgi:hypothetical protein